MPRAARAPLTRASMRRPTRSSPTARKFGTEHQDTITKGVIGGAATAVGARIVGESIKVVFRR